MNSACRLRIGHRQRGVGIVELMVGMAIGLAIVLAAAALYTNLRQSTRASTALSEVNETGALVMSILGGELQRAGFYPAQYPTPGESDQVLGHFKNIKNAAKPAYDQGLFGCDGAVFDVTKGACGNATAGAVADSIVINYFAAAEFGADSLIGTTRDCNRAKVSADAINTAYDAASLPMYVSNRFALTSTTYTGIDKTTVSTWSLACNGNGKEADGYRPQMQGVEDMVIRYGLSNGTSQSPTQYRTATDVSNDTSVVDGRNAWQRVTAVKVCVVVRSLDRVRQEDKAKSERKFANCRGQNVDISGNRFLYKKFEQVFAVRNNLNGTL